MEVSEDVLLKAVDLALGMGSSYAETRFQVDSVRFIHVRNGALQSIGNYSYGGVSVRVLLMVCGVSQQLATPPGTQLRMP